MQSLIWRIKFYNGERKAHSLVRSIKYFALVWSLAWCTVTWATRRLGDRRLGDKLFPKCPFGRHEIGRLGDKSEVTLNNQLRVCFIGVHIWQQWASKG